jgi:transmembrane sensor
MQRKDIKEVLERVRAGNYTSEDEAIAKYWIHQSHQDDDVSLSKEEWLKVKHNIWAGLETTETINQPIVKRLWPRIGIVAAVATIIISAGIWFLKNPAKDPIQQSAYLNDVAPGKKGATLTLANGKKIRLIDAANGELAKEAGVVITKTAGGQLIYEIKDENTESDKINMLTTDNGETYQVRLPDGSSVWLNAASTLKYPSSFAKLKERRVELSGEGYFEVSKDKAHPFIVKTAEQEVEVLGTHFNVNAYADEKAVATTLLEGSVKVSSDEKNNKILKPGEQALNKGNTILVKEVDTENITDWKEGDFNLDQVDFRIAMRKIARWYDVEVIYDDNLSNDIQISGWISRSKKLSSVLKFIESSGLVHFKVEGRKVYVSK